MSGINAALAASAASALVLTVLAARGFGQSAFARVLDGLLALGFLGYAGYLLRTRPDAAVISYVFAVPVVALLLMWPAWRRARARRFAAGLTPTTPYAEQNAPTPLTPFPPPPAPWGSPAYRPLPVDDLPERPVSPGPGVTRPPIPSGLAGHQHAEPTLPGAYQPKPSGLSAHHAAPPAPEPAPGPPTPSGLPDGPLHAARHAAPAGPPDPPPYVGTHSGEQPMYRTPSVERPADGNVTTWPAAQPAGAWPTDQQLPGWPSAGRHIGHAETGLPATTQSDYDTVRETSSRLRQPAYLAKYAPAEPHDPGRHRAADAPEPPGDWPPAGPPGDWPPKEWPPPRR